MPTQREQFAATLKAHAPDFGVELSRQQIDRLTDYYSLVMKWNELHLVAPCTAEEFAVRHVLESLTLLKYLPARATVLDVGSGGGLPIVPCLLVRDDVQATLIDSSQRKAVFLREALRPVEPAGRASVIADRFEQIDLPEADFLTCRGLDRFSRLLPLLVARARPKTTLLLFAGKPLSEQIQLLLSSATVDLLPFSQNRYLIIGQKA